MCVCLAYLLMYSRVVVVFLYNKKGQKFVPVWASLQDISDFKYLPGVCRRQYLWNYTKCQHTKLFHDTFEGEVGGGDITPIAERLFF